ncbi:hypothetical protein B0O80DRAFT_105854 [Mortierella sp. GBAus27b]|nr:hypothetical protein B0O80DRAFT_105854 [Mortierella sp. GBAus27b]
MESASEIKHGRSIRMLVPHGRVRSESSSTGYRLGIVDGRSSHVHHNGILVIIGLPAN